MPRPLTLRARAQSMIEHPDPTPVEIAVDRRPQTLREQLQGYIRQQVSMLAEANDMATFEDEDDFSEDESDVWVSPYELHDMHPDSVDDSPMETLDGTDDKTPPLETPAETTIEASPESGGNA